MGISIRAYARHRGVSHVAVLKAIDAGRITPEADGSINSERADQDWTANTSQPKHRMRQKLFATVGTVSPTPSAVPITALDASGKGMNLLTARTANEIVKAQTGKVRLSKLKGDLIDKSPAIAHAYKWARAERDSWVNWPSRVSATMAAHLKVDAHTMHVALESAVREHLQELGELQLRLD